MIAYTLDFLANALKVHLTLIRPDTFTNTSGRMGSNLTPNIFWCNVTPLAVCFTQIELLSIGNVIDHTLALYLTFLDLIYFYFCGNHLKVNDSDRKLI